jgi:transcription elongation factor Elf1
MEQLSYKYTCPYCGEEISSLLDLSMEKQEYFEDCEVCCNPINIKFVADGKSVISFEAVRTE